MKKVLIVEDNPVMAENLSELVKKAQSDVCVYVAGDSERAYSIAMEKEISLMLIDIVLDSKVPGDVSGMRFAQNIRTVDKYRFTPLIMVTSLEDPKLYAYSEVHCYRYIEKPYDPDEVVQVVREALQYRKTVAENKKYIYKNDGIFYSVNLEEVVYAESRNKMVCINTTMDNIEVPYCSMVKLLKDFNNDNFVQCSRNCIINKQFIEYVDTANRVVKLKGVARQIDIGITMKKDFLAHIKND